MEKYPKLFVLAATIYLVTAVLMGLGFTVGVLDPLAGKFVHIHIGLLGFIAMFIYGLAYHVLPRFNAKPIRRQYLVPTHFYLVNAGLIGMAVFGYMDGMYAGDLIHTGFLVSATMEVAGILLFAYNLIPVLLPISEPQAIQVEKEEEVTADMKVTTVLDKWPSLLEIFKANGFKALSNPAARATFAKAITVSRACKLHNVDSQQFLQDLNDAVRDGVEDAGEAAPEPEPETPQQKTEQAMAGGKQIQRGEAAATETLIGSLIETYPETKEIFEKHYGSGCFSCPGQAFETISQTAMMHGIKPQEILDEINEKIGEALKDAPVG